MNRYIPESDISPFSFAKIAVDKIFSGNQYIVTLRDIWSEWLECFSVPNKVETVSFLLVEEIFTRFATHSS